MKCRLLRDMDGSDGLPKPAGTIIDHIDAWQLVQMGIAEPADAECEEFAEMTPEQIEEAAAEYDRFLAGLGRDPFLDDDEEDDSEEPQSSKIIIP